jgi:hypothetical protein
VPAKRINHEETTKMNKTYALVWNGAQRCWTAAGETARRRDKASGGKRAAVTAVSLPGFAALPAFALPTGEAITSGNADILRAARRHLQQRAVHTGDRDVLRRRFLQTKPSQRDDDTSRTSRAQAIRSLPV